MTRHCLGPLLSMYGFLIYLYWRLRNYDQVEALVSLMIPDWRLLRILDVGSGVGRVAGDPRLKEADITCVDASRKAILACRRKGLRALQMDIRDIPEKLGKDKFDIIWCLDVLEHLPKGEALQLLSQFERMARRQVIVFLPLGYVPQDKDPSGESDPRFVRHRSFWEREDFASRGYRCHVLWGYHWDIRLYCSTLAQRTYPVVRNAMWAVNG